ncbi:hypothetical protein Tsp_08775, partial [Trichinella spiralis]
QCRWPFHLFQHLLLEYLQQCRE